MIKDILRTEDSKYWNPKTILSLKCHYNMVIGERSNGKTYGALEQGIKHYFETGGEMAIIRRYDMDFRGKNGRVMFASLEANGVVEKYSKGKYTGISYYSGSWYFTYKDDKEKEVKAEKPFCYAFALNTMEHDKSTSYPNIQTVIFDEFITRSYYLNDEFVIFCNVLSTIIRQRNNITIFMLANTVNKTCPYFTEMGLKHVAQQKQGTIEVYEYGETGLKVAVEYCGNINKKSKPSDVYFSFDNPKLQMITGGVWELALYPHLPYKYDTSEVIYNYFIYFDDNLLQAEIIQHDNDVFTFIHRKTTPIKDENYDLVYTTEYSPKPNFRRMITKPTTIYEKKILEFFVNEKVFYQDNEVGEIVRNYFNWCKSFRIN